MVNWTTHKYLPPGTTMIYKFKSQADADVIMLEPNGDQMLTIIGRQPSAQGVITVAQIPEAIAALEASIIAHEAAESHEADNRAMKSPVADDGIRLRARAGPFIALLHSSGMAGKDVVWGV
jgi:cyclopropane-fatty-acyl-phospholipid synthase